MMTHVSKFLNAALIAQALAPSLVIGASLSTHQASRLQSTEEGYGGTDLTQFCQMKLMANKDPAYKHTQVKPEVWCAASTAA